MKYVRMPIEIESPEQMGYGNVKFNLTESSFTDMKWDELKVDLKDLLLCYVDHLGHPGFRKLIADEAGIKPEQVILTAGAAPALFMVSTNLLEKGDRLLVVRPNYATNIETPRAIGAQIDFCELKIEDGFQINADQLISMIKPDTKLVSITIPHNPTGVVTPTPVLKKIIAEVEKRGIWLLVDETYRDMAFENPIPYSASLSKRVISVSSLSKTWGLPGIRMGWAMCQDAEMMEKLLAAKEQIFICGSAVDEELGYRFYLKRKEILPLVRSQIEKKRKIVLDWLTSEQRLEFVKPEGGVVCFPRIKDAKPNQIESFYRILNGKYFTFVGPGHWFEQDRSMMRVGFGWPEIKELEQGLKNISLALDEALV